MTENKDNTSGIIQRLRDLIKRKADGKVFNFAKKAGIPAAALQRGLDGGALPSALNFIKICSYAGVSADWLLTGKEPEGKGERKLKVDSDVLSDILYSIDLFLVDHNKILDPAKKAELATLIYDDIESGRKVDSSRMDLFVKLAN